MFHVLPIVSRTELKLTSLDVLPSPDVLTSLPIYLLAALYATALPFSAEDDELALCSTYGDRPQDELWIIAYECLQDEIRRPRISVLQAALLYLHKTSQHQTQSNPQDTAFVWSFLGSVVGLAHNLGLHLECSMYAIPAKEKRLRRRLWWAVYIEDKWLSLLLGRPSYIQQGEFDVSELSEFDFLGSGITAAESHRVFQDCARLAVIADSLRVSL